MVGSAYANEQGWNELLASKAVSRRYVAQDPDFLFGTASSDEIETLFVLWVAV